MRTAAVMILTMAIAGGSASQAAGQDTKGGAKVSQLRVYIGTYTGPKSKGIYLSTLDLATGKLSDAVVAAETTSPSFLAVHPSKKFLYAVGEISDFQGQKAGGVSAFAIDPASGKLTLLNQQTSGGAGPCHLVVDATGKAVLVANYGGGSVESIPLAADGKLGEPASFIQHAGSSVNKSRQSAPHGHSINVDPTNRFAVAADLGLDQVLVYKFDAATAKLTPNDPPFTAVAPGSGPRHFAFHPGGKYAYVINEITCTVTAFDYNSAKGTLTEIQTITTLPHEVRPGYSTAEVVVHPSGKFLYGSNRGHDSIAVFQIVAANGTLTAVEHEPTQGKTPRNFAIDPTGKFLLAENQASDTIVVFAIDQSTGKLEPTGHKIEVPSPVCVRFVPLP
jgi:6-phosphogluconolactonase